MAKAILAQEKAGFGDSAYKEAIDLNFLVPEGDQELRTEIKNNDQ